MKNQTPVAVVGIGAIMPDANDANQFWQNILSNKYSISEVPESRWHPDLFYHPDPQVPDKTYSKIGGWVNNYEFNPMKWGILIPPKVLDNMDDSQKWAIAVTRQALQDYGYPERPLNLERVAVILGNAMAGEHHYQTNLRIHAPEFTKALSDLAAFKSLSATIQKSLLSGMLTNIQDSTPPINEDTMPGELSNIIAGRVANVYNFGGANFVTDAACASSLAALQSAVEGLAFHKFDAVLTGGIDRNMGPGSFVKFCKIGALSPDGSRPYAAGANGFVMGEGAAVFLLKRLEDAERDGDKIYAVIRGIGSSSDGKGKGITAPNPVGQERAISRAWKNAGVNPASVGLIEGHGTSTRVGDRVEIQSLAAIFGNIGLKKHSVGLGSVKSNIGHLKSAAGAAGLFKAIYALDKKVLPPSTNFKVPNPEINFDNMPFYIVTEPQEWERPDGEIRRAGVSSFGFGGTNFHVVLEEYIPGRFEPEKQISPVKKAATETAPPSPQKEESMVMKNDKNEINQFVYLGENTTEELKNRLAALIEDANQGDLSNSVAPGKKVLSKSERLVISYQSDEDFLKKAKKAMLGLKTDQETPWKAYTSRGIYRGTGKPGKVAFLFPGQGSQYANMLKDLADQYPVVKETFAEADQIMISHLGKPLTNYIFTEDTSDESIAQTEEALKDTTITQPAVLTANIAIMRLLAQNNIYPDALIGHSLGEYAALVAANALSFKDALEVVSARGHAMAALEVEDNGCMAAVLAPIEDVEKILETIDDYVVLANINSPIQSVVGGNVKAVELAIEKFKDAGMQAVKIPVSHAFHTKIVAPAADTLRNMIESMDLQVPSLPIAANVTGNIYPDSRLEIVDLLSDHIASPVQFVKGIQTLYDSGCRIFIESGPKRVLNSLANDILKEYEDAAIIATNHPRKGGVESFHEALCQCYALGLGVESELVYEIAKSPIEANEPNQTKPSLVQPEISDPQQITGSVVISGAGIGLPGRSKHVFSEDNIERILNGESFIEPLPTDIRQGMIDKKVTRLIKSDAGAQMVVLDDLDQTIKLAGQTGAFDLTEEFGVPKERVGALDITTQLAMAAGIDALKDAGIPLVMHYKQTSTGSYLPDRWMLPASMRDDTGIIFGSAFPGLDQLSDEADRYYLHKQLNRQLEDMKQILSITPQDNPTLIAVLQEKITGFEQRITQLDYRFDRKFIFRVLNMGHSQFAEYIGARGPNTAVNAACATTTHAISIAEDWIRNGRCQRVVIVAGDDVTGGSLVSWVGTGLLASGATTTEGDLENAALPFDRRRNGMIMGMGAAALVVESEDSVRERGMKGICEILSTDTANSAYHGTRLDINHVSRIMQRVIEVAEKRFGIDKHKIASQTMFMSHETYTPARGGSAAAEIEALKSTFSTDADQILIANTKGYTGHTMGVGIEDVVAVKALEYGIVPPIANINHDFEPDPNLGNLNLSKGGTADIQYALRLGAGFGSQVAMTLLRKIPDTKNRVNHSAYKQWLAAVSGNLKPEIEIKNHTLRIVDKGVPTDKPSPSKWVYGHGPSLWAAVAKQKAVSATELEPENASMPKTSPVAIPTEEEIKMFLLNLVSEKTGYPVEILEMDLDLEADLGIDTVKQAELFSAVRENYNIPRREDLMLVEYNTLQKVVKFVQNSIETEMQSPSSPELSKILSPDLIPATNVNGGKITQTLPPEDEIKEFLLNLVSEKTGYPVEILELDLDLEADLGIDTVKQAELFSAVRENYNIPRREDLMLVEYNTLEKVIGFVQDSFEGYQPQSDIVSQPAPESEPLVVSREEPSQQPTRDEIKNFLLALVSEKTGYPVEILELDLDLEADLGIDTVKQAELFSAVRENYNIPRREDLMLVEYNTLEKVIGFVQDSFEGYQPQSDIVSQPAPESEPLVVSREEPSQQPTRDEIKNFLLALVSEKTGYPVEILELDLDLEADLGIDTVKQAELFSAVRENYHIPRREDLMLVEYNTLEKVISFVQDSLDEINQISYRPENDETLEVFPQILEQPANIGADDFVPQSIMRRVPVPLLRPRHDLCKPTGVVFNKDSRVMVIEDETGIADELIDLLLKYKVKVFKLKTRDLDQQVHTISTWLEDGAFNGIFFLASLNQESPLKNMATKDWETLLKENVYALFRIMQTLPENVFLVCATNIGGLHGINQPEIYATGGGVSGFCKALAIERPDSLIKVVDFHREDNASYIAAQLMAETQRDPAVVEVGYNQGQRFGISIEERSLAAQTQHLPKNCVFLITGGTGGIISPIVQDLSKNTNGKFYLTGRTNLPSPDDPLMSVLKTSGQEGVQKAIIDKMANQSQKLTPVELRNKVDRFIRAADTGKFIEELNKAGIKAAYLVADVTNPDDIERVVTTILQEEGRIDAVVHGAGFERSRKLSKKSFDEFERTMNVKASGFFFLYRALRDHNALPQHFVLFSSVAGRFGNTGQTDYSAANDLATKISAHLNATHPNTRMTTIDWGPWDEVGMASRGAVPRLMSMAGIEMMDPQIAAKLVYAELTRGGGQEVIYAGSLGILESQINGKSGLDIEKSNRALRAGNPPTLILSEVTGFDSKNGATFEVTLDPNNEPFLHDHAINGTPLFPGVMGIEGFSAAAQHIASVLGSGNPPGLQLTELENIRFENAFKFYRNEPRHIIWKALPLWRETGIEVYVTLESHNPSRLDEVPQLVQHFSGTVHLKANQQAVDQLVTIPPSWNGKTTLSGDEIYALYFHGPAFQVIEGVQRDKEGLLGKLNLGLPPFTSQPVSLDTSPVLIELCLQTSGIWEIGKTGIMSLPKSIGRVRLYRRETNGDPIFAQVQPLPSDNGFRFNSRVLDSKGRIYLELEDYRTVALPTNFDGSALTSIRNLVNGNGENPA